MLTGSIVAIITPMHEDGSIDFECFSQLLDWHLSNNTQGIVVAGTTGESCTLKEEEKQQLLSLALQRVNKQIPIIAGTGTNSTDETIKRTQAAEKLGVDACLIVTPYYNKPTQKGLYAHYKKIAENTSLPIILYNVPSRTCCDLLPETVAKLSRLPNIVGVKEATADISRVAKLVELCGDGFAIYSGDDATAFDLMLMGGHGVISVTANVAPKLMQTFCEAALSRRDDAKQLNERLMPLHTKLFLESNPIPTKWVLKQMGKSPGGIRLPLLPLDEKFHGELREIIGLL